MLERKHAGVRRCDGKNISVRVSAYTDDIRSAPSFSAAESGKSSKQLDCFLTAVCGCMLAPK